MGKILGIAIKNYGSLKDIKMGQLYSGQTGVPLGNMVAIIGPSGNGKSTLADAFGFIADALTTDVESACDASNRGGYDKLVSQGSNGPIHFEIYYKENSNSRPITYELTIGKDKYDRPYVKDERLRQRRPGNKSGRPSLGSLQITAAFSGNKLSGHLTKLPDGLSSSQVLSSHVPCRSP